MNAPAPTAATKTPNDATTASPPWHRLAGHGLLAGFQAAGIGLALVTAPVILMWLTAGDSRAGLGAAARTSAVVWLAAHRTTITTPTGQITLVPLGLTMLLAGLCWWFARRVAPVAPGAGRSATAAAHLAFTGAYASCTLVLAMITAAVAARPHVETALLGGVLLSGLASAVPWWLPGSWRARIRGARGGSSGPEQAHARVLARAVVAIVGFAGAVSTLLVAASLLINYSRVQAIYTALDPGPLGTVGLGLVHLAAFPLVIVWGLAWLAGPGFSVGLGTSVTSSGTTLGPLPALPLLGAMPTPGTNPGWWAPLAAGVFVMAGALAGRVIAAERSWATGRQVWRDILITAVLAGAAVGMLSWWASGSLGSAAMSVWGPRPVWVTALVAGETLVGTALTAWAWPGLRRGGPTPAEVTGPSA